MPSRIECPPPRYGRVGKPDAAEAFWRFSVAFYERPAVAEALLALQDRDGRDVNLVLFALWLGVSGRGALDAARLAAAEFAVAAFRVEIVEPLRRVRRRLKQDAAADLRDLRRRLQEVELDAEKAAQRRLAATAPEEGPIAPLADRVAAAGASLGVYLGPDAVGSAEARLLLNALSAFVTAAE
ncbi:MAG TPA: TIGR02444 family protein [Stellaceae bacterium]|nr:TIGR02444 family protein [Stellaceae bacterium]